MKRSPSRFAFALAIAVAASTTTACTPGSLGTSGALGATPAGNGAGAGGAPNPRNVTTIDVNLTRDPNGYAPQLTMLAVGDGVRFANTDGFAHTATSIAGSTFPSAYPFDSSALAARGTALSQGFSSGSLPAGSVSATLVADRAGTYLFGCFYHYGSPMRATIVVQ